jgi:hypothetical protein
MRYGLHQYLFYGAPERRLVSAIETPKSPHDQRLFESRKDGLYRRWFQQAGRLPVLHAHFAQRRIGTDLARNGHDDHIRFGIVVAPFETTTAGRFLLAVWLVKGKGTNRMSPNSKGIVDVVVLIVPHARERWSAGGSGGSGKGTILCPSGDEIDEVFHFRDPLGRQGTNLVEQGLRIGGHREPL